MKMQHDQQCNHPGDQPPVQLYILVVYSDNLTGSLHCQSTDRGVALVNYVRPIKGRLL